tara:strand:+ start:643 stop:1143 length:501 start_codon:yes stop_codon:yes gene_type:complete
MSQLKVNSIVPVNGLPSGANGGIIQVVQTFKNDATSTTSNSFSDLTGMTATITPSSNSNKVLVSFSLCLSSADSPVIHINLVRGSTNIAQPSTTPDHYSTMMAYTGASKIMQQGYEFLDSPSTTSATTYKLQWRNHATGFTSKLNEYFNQTNYNGTSTLTLMEVTS